MFEADHEQVLHEPAGMEVPVDLLAVLEERD